MHIDLKRVNIRVVSGKKNETLLSNINISISTGLTAVVGPSGCGKTSFLKAIAGKVPKTSITSGAIYFSGQKRILKEWIKTATYMDQDDIMHCSFTAFETLLFTAKFSPNYDEDKMAKTIEMVAKRLYIQDCLDQVVSNLSGGQFKRLKVALELIRDSQVILLDEPTTGLDNVLAYRMVQFLHEIASNGKIIICSIHQPDDRTLLAFDNIVLVCEGRIVYHGEPAHVERAISQKGFVNTDGLELTTFILDFLNVDRIEYFDKEKHREIIKCMADEYTINNQEDDHCYIERRKNDFFANIVPNLSHIMVLSGRLYRGLASKKYIAVFLMPNFLILSVPLVFLYFVLNKTGIMMDRNVAPAISSQDTTFVHILCTFLCIAISNAGIVVSQQRRVFDALVNKEIDSSFYSITSHYVCTLLVTNSFFLPVLLVALLIFMYALHSIFDNISLLLILLYYFSTVFYVNVLFDISRNDSVRYILTMYAIFSNSCPWIIAPCTKYIDGGVFRSVFYCIVLTTPASTIIPIFITRYLANMLKVIDKRDVAAINAHISVLQDVERKTARIDALPCFPYVLVMFMLVIYILLSYFINVSRFSFHYRADLSKQDTLVDV